jgi:hypothetical protein
LPTNVKQSAKKSVALVNYPSINAFSLAIKKRPF